MTATRFVTMVLVLGGLFVLLLGIWAFVAPHSFYDQLAPFPPYNRHFLHDVGAFQIGVGVALLLASRWDDARFVTLAGAASGAAAHLVSHIVDNDLGGRESDVFGLALIAVLLAAGSIVRWRSLDEARAG